MKKVKFFNYLQKTLLNVDENECTIIETIDFDSLKDKAKDYIIKEYKKTTKNPYNDDFEGLQLGCKFNFKHKILRISIRINNEDRFLIFNDNKLIDFLGINYTLTRDCYNLFLIYYCQEYNNILIDEGLNVDKWDLEQDDRRCYDNCISQNILLDKDNNELLHLSWNSIEGLFQLDSFIKEKYPKSHKELDLTGLTRMDVLSESSKYQYLDKTFEKTLIEKVDNLRQY